MAGTSGVPGSLMFTAGFDFSKAESKAKEDVDKIVDNLQKKLNNKKLEVKLDFGKSGDFGKLTNDIKNVITEIKKAQNEYQKLSQSQNTGGGNMSSEMQKVAEQLKGLTASLDGYVKKLDEVTKKQKQNNNAKASGDDKAIKKAKELEAALKLEETSIDKVTAKLKAYKQVAKSSDEGTAKYTKAIAEIERLGAALDRMNAKLKNAQNAEKNNNKIEEAYAKRIALREKEAAKEEAAYQKSRAARQATIQMLKAEENSIDAVNNKIKFYTKLAQGAGQNSSTWNFATEKVRQLKETLSQLIIEFKKATQVQALADALARTEKTIDNLTMKLQSLKGALGGMEFGTAIWNRTALEIAKVSQELQVVNQKLADYQQKAFRQLGDSWTAKQVEQLTKLRTQLEDIDGRFNRLNQRGKAVDANGMYTDAANKILDERIAKQKQINDMLLTGADAAIKREQQLNAEIEKRRRLIEELQGRANTLKGPENSINQLTAKMNAWQSIMNNAEVGSKAFIKAGNEVGRLRDLLGFAKAEAAALTGEMKKTSDVKTSHSEFIKLKEVLLSSEKTLEGLNAKLRVYQEFLQNRTVGSDIWNRTALEIRRLTEEVERATQRMRDFQQYAFKGLDNYGINAAVQQVTKLRSEIDALDRQIHRIQQIRVNTNNPTYEQDKMNKLLDERYAKEQKINKYTTSAIDLQIQRQKQLTVEVERRKRLEEKKARSRETLNLLTQEQRTIEGITAKLRIYTNLLNRADPNNARAFEYLAQKVRGLTTDLEKAQQKMGELTGKTTTGANQQRNAVRSINEEFRKQSGYVENLVRRLAVYASIGAIGGFLTKVREVTAQFELQRISLGAIIQDQTRANQLFSEIKSFALQSPLKILDLTKYTKQLAAYRIETDKLFDTTKRLADISVGLGVDMQRLILFYGQVRAAGYLRASEVRQATEAGIPLVEELAKKLSEANGQLVTAAQVMDMISERQIPFEMVAEVFEDMTNKGGVFYDMQIKQGNTLYGMWQKLGDAAAMMYDEIGRTNSVNSSMKMTISTVRKLMLNWKQTGVVLAGLGAIMALNIINQRNMRLATVLSSEANTIHIATLDRKLMALRLEQASLKSSAVGAQYYTGAMIAATQAQLQAATATNVFSRAFYNLKAAFLSNPFGLAIVALSTLIGYLATAESEISKLNSKLSSIDADYSNTTKKSVENFKELVEAALDAADGSKTQKDALDELSRTYGDMFDKEYLEIENLKKIRGNYDEATAAIMAYNEAKKGSEKETAIKESYTAQTNDAKEKLEDYLKFVGLTDQEISEFFSNLSADLAKSELDWDHYLAAFNKNMSKLNKNASASFKQIFNVTNLDRFLDSWQTMLRTFDYLGKDFIYDYIRMQLAMNEALDENEQATRRAASGFNEYYDIIKNLGAALSDTIDYSSYDALNASQEQYNSQHPNNPLEIPINLTYNPGQFETTAQNALEEANAQIWVIIMAMKDMAAQAGVIIPEEFFEVAKSVAEGNKDYSFIDFEALKKLFKNSPAALAAINAAEEFYKNLAPSDHSVRAFNVRFRKIMDEFKDVSKDLEKFLMKNGDTLQNHRKKLKAELVRLAGDIATYQYTIAKLKEAGESEMIIADVEKKLKDAIRLRKAIEKAFGELPDYDAIEHPKKTKEKRVSSKRESRPSTTKKEDTSKQDLVEVSRLLEDIYKKYKELEKVEGPSLAAEHTKEAMQATLNKANELFKKHGGKSVFDFPFSLEKLDESFDLIIARLGQLKNFKIEVSKKYTDHINKEIEAYNKGNIKLGNSLRLNRPGKYATVSFLKDTDKDIAELLRREADLRLNMLRDFIKDKLKDIASEISRTKEVRDFYEKILSATGDIDLATNVTLSIYGEIGDNLKQQLLEQVRGYFVNSDVEFPLDVVLTDGSIDYLKLENKVRELEEELGQDTYNALLKIAQEGQKDWAKTFENYLKDIEKAKTYSQKRIELARTTANEINKIRRGEAGVLDEKEQDYLIRGLEEKAAKEAAKQEWEAFKETPMYVQMFDDLEYASTKSLSTMRDMLENMKKVWGENLDPQNLKEMQSRLNEINEQIVKRNPFKGMKEGMQTIRKLNKDYGSQALIAKKLSEATKDLIFEKSELNRMLSEEGNKSKELADAQKKYQESLKKLEEIENSVSDEDWDNPTWFNSPEGRAYQEKLKLAQEEVEANAQLVEEVKEQYELTKQTATQQGIYVEETEKLVNELSDVNDQYNNGKKEIGESIGALREYVDKVNEAVGAIRECVEEWSALADDETWGYIWDGFDKFTESVGSATESAQAFLSTDYFTAITKALASTAQLASAIAKWVWGAKVAAANEEIERQAEILEQLEYTYDRLQKAQEKLFGSEYIQNYNQQLDALNAKAEAYRKQMEAEQSKGKKKDKDKVKEYEEAWRDTMDDIYGMQTELQDYLLGTDLTSAARDFANSWLEARWAFEDTTEAMREKFADMVQNMIVESMAAQLMEGILDPIYKEIKTATADGKITAEEIATIAKHGYEAIGTMNDAMETMLTELQNAGLNISQMFEESSGEATGIARNVSNATSEEINANTAALNTQNYYMSYISENVLAIKTLMEGGEAMTVGANTDLITLQNEHLAQLPEIARNTLATAERCERAAIACEEMRDTIARVVEYKGSKAVVNTALN